MASARGWAMPQNLKEARQELERLVILESAAEHRQARVEEFLRRLVRDFGFTAADLARRLGVSERSIESLVSGDDPPSVAERLDVSEESVRLLLADD